MFFAEWKILKNLLRLRYVVAPLYLLLALEISNDGPHKQRWGGLKGPGGDTGWDLGKFFSALVGSVEFTGRNNKPYYTDEIFEAWLELVLWLLA